MLLGKKRGRRKQGDLFTACNAYEGCTQSDFGFAKAHIAADQPVHRLRRDHVLNHGMDGCALIRRFVKAKVFGKALVIVGRVFEGMALPQSAAGVDIEQFSSRVAHLLCCFAPRFFPLA